MTSENTDIANFSYEAARAELVAIVQNLESGSAPLAESLALWERGEALATHCQSILDAANQKLAAATATP